LGRRQVQHSTDMLYVEYAVNDALVASHIFLRKAKTRLSKKRRTVKRNAV